MTAGLSVAVSGLPSTGNFSLFEKADGTYDFLIWNEAPDWNPQLKGEIPIAATIAAVQFGSSFEKIEVFDPLLGNAPIASYGVANQVQVSLTDHPLIVQLSSRITSPTVVQPITLGQGSDVLMLNVSEDAWNGDAKFVVSVDETQIGTIQTATALHSAGHDQQYAIYGNFGVGQHTVSVDFLNDAYGGTPATDRNLYVDATSYDGAAVAPGTMTLMSAGTSSETVGAPESAVKTTIGYGPDQIVLDVAEDYYIGNAQFVVSVDGVQTGGIQTVVASRTAGQDQVFDLNGNWGPGQHIVAVDFLNDAYGGTPQLDRNLYVNSTSYDGVTATPGAMTFLSAGTDHEIVGTSVGSMNTTIGSGTDKILLGLAEDYYLGNAQFTVAVDGVQMGSIQTAFASKAAGQEQLLQLNGNWGT